MKVLQREAAVQAAKCEARSIKEGEGDNICDSSGKT